MEEIGMEMASQTMPMWVNVFIGIVAALGGWEAIKYLISLRANRQKDKAEANEAEAAAHSAAASAGQQDADWRQKELELMTQFVDTAKAQYQDLVKRYEDLKAEKEEDRGIKAALRREVNELKMEQSEQWRIITGIQKEWNRLISQKKDAEAHYCADENCKMRKPKLGEYQTATPDFNTLIQPRDKRTGRYISKKAAEQK